MSALHELVALVPVVELVVVVVLPAFVELVTLLELLESTELVTLVELLASRLVAAARRASWAAEKLAWASLSAVRKAPVIF